MILSKRWSQFNVYTKLWPLWASARHICVYTSYLVLKKKNSGEIKRLILLHLSFKIGLVLVVGRKVGKFHKLIPTWTVLVFINVTVNPAVCASSLIKIMFLVLNYYHCYYQWFFKFPIFLKAGKNSKTYYYSLIKMTNYSHLLGFLNRKNGLSVPLLSLINFWLLGWIQCAGSSLGRKTLIQFVNCLINNLRDF